ncbi:MULTISPECIES: ABC transporter ATP-binding protein [unclassified Brevibacterium]|uniref:ABC transporter ATP-binding protein n=1 Tax=unclassified Brevibacterium TaxID=2614124 RepID=UPI0010F4B86A|nr:MULTISPECIES: ABC transporter ATP-binding protein [unclassified Brevibacterium]MCM1013585.1 ATP-binding cassette domain-containing protein [Brevibacterium sp. XM4083]
MGLPIRAHGYSWRHADRDSLAVGPVDLDIAPGEKVLLLGPSGAGKSTLLHAIAGVLPTEAGESGGEFLVGEAAPDPRRGVTGLVLQDPNSQVIFSRIGDDVAFGMENLGLPAEVVDARIDASLAAMGLDLPQSHPTAALSGGQKQRLALAGIHAMAPEVIVLDEPTANIDPVSARAVRDAVLTVQESTAATMIVVEHRVGLWSDDVDTVIVLGRAGIVAHGTPDEVFGDPALTEVLKATGIWLPESGSPTATDRWTVPARTGAQDRLGSPVLVGERLSVARPRATVPAATDLDLEVRAGEALGIVGANGAGKSTTALTLAGLIPEFSGVVRAAGPLAAGAKEARPFTWPSKFLAPRIGMVFQEPEHQFLKSSVADELALGPRLAGWSTAEVDARVTELLETLGLADIADAHPQGLSGGEKRRLSVAAMIAPRPQVLIVDEPTFGQDALTWAGLVALFLDVLDHGSAVVAVSHDLDFLDAIGARRFTLGTAAQTLRGERVE